MVLIRCKCLNLRLQLVSPPAPTTDFKWVTEQTTMKKIGEAKLSPNSVKMEQDLLFSYHIVSGWNVWKCINCNTDVCAVDLKDNTNVLVNLELEENRGSTSIDDERYSHCFHVLIENTNEDKDEQNAKPEMNSENVEAFNKLQQQADKYVAEAERLMEKRIKAFMKAQQEEFSKIKSRAYNERAILWKKTCTTNKSRSNSITTTTSAGTISPSSIRLASSVPSKQTSSPSRLPAMSESIPAVPTIKPPTTNASKKWMPAAPLSPSSDVNRKKPGSFQSDLRRRSSEDIFDFDDDDGAPPEIPERKTVPSEDLEDDFVEEEEEENNEERKEDSSRFMGTSLPVSIPRMNQQPHSRPTKLQTIPEKAEPDAEKRGGGRQLMSETWSARTTLVEDTDLPAEVAASFAVPLSLNRRIKSMI